MLGCCGCCPKTRYKRLVDNIFPADPKDGLVKSNMEKLTFYASSQPEKLDRIGDYLVQKVSVNIYRNRLGFVEIAMEAMDILLSSCTPQTLNLFVESYLKMIQLLLETSDAQMQLLATLSFTKFANIQEDTPSYHRRYDFFVSKFSSLSYDNNPEIITRSKMRIAGLNGLKGVIRKTVSDDLQVDIWDDTHMEKIIPSLLFNMQESSDQVTSPTQPFKSSPADVTDSPNSICLPVLRTETPSMVAEENLRELMGKATFGSITKVIKPVLTHLDLHDLWVPHQTDDDLFAVDVFKLIMFSISSQHSYAVVQILMKHLDDITFAAKRGEIPIEKSTHIRTGIATVLSNIVAITASESIGPIVLDIINNLLNHLRSSISNCLNANTKTSDGEKEFQETVINTLGEFANNLPDFQKIEIMMFIISKVPPTGSTPNKTDSLLQGILLRSLLKVSTKYNTVNISQALPSSFLKPLLQMSLASDPSVRLTVQHIFHQLLDRHCNLPKISKPITLASLPSLTVEKAFRQDVMFMKKHGTEIIGSVFENVQLSNNNGENYNALYTTLALLCCEMFCDEVLIETIRLTFSMQKFASESTTNLSEQHKAAIHALVAAILYLTSCINNIPQLTSHVHEVIKSRQEMSPWMLPESNRYYNTVPGRRPSLISVQVVSDDLLFKTQHIIEVLQAAGHETAKLEIPLSSSVVDSGISRSISDLNSVTLEVDSNNSSPGLPRRTVVEDVTFDSFRKILHEPSNVDSEAREERRAQIVETYRTTPFVELIAREEKKTTDFQSCLENILSRVSAMTEISPTSSHEPLNDVSGDVSDAPSKNNSSAVDQEVNPVAELCSTKFSSKRPPLFALQFPDLFVY